MGTHCNLWPLYLVMCSGLSCGEPYYGPGMDGFCRNDEDLEVGDNWYEGAHCVNGMAQCPNGEPPCISIQDNDIVVGCVGPCLECPSQMTPCPNIDEMTQSLDYVCVHSPSECGSDYNFVSYQWTKKNCPTMNPSCL